MIKPVAQIIIIHIGCHTTVATPAGSNFSIWLDLFSWYVSEC